MNLGMIGVSLFGTCTMKYNPRINQLMATRPEIAELHPYQDEDTLQGVFEVISGLDLFLRELSGMDQFVFQAGGGLMPIHHACITRAYHAARGELGQRDEIITTIQAHPCNAATAATAGFKVVTLPLEENGYPSLEALRAAVSTERPPSCSTTPMTWASTTLKSKNGCGQFTTRGDSASTTTQTSTA